jgi:hypothetical protein
MRRAPSLILLCVVAFAFVDASAEPQKGTTGRRRRLRAGHDA